MSTNLNWSENEIAHQIGERYVEDKFPEEDQPLVERAYREIAKRTEILYDQIPVPVIWTDMDPYEDFGHMVDRIAADDELLVYTGGSVPRYLSHEENVKGRAVHDYFGHYRHFENFSVQGEFMKWYHTRHYYTGEDPNMNNTIRHVLFTEIVAQTCAASYLDGGFDDERFEQRPIIAPHSWINLCKEAFL